MVSLLKIYLHPQHVSTIPLFMSTHHFITTKSPFIARMIQTLDLTILSR